MADRSFTFRWVAEDFIFIFDHTDALDDREWDEFVAALAERTRASSGVRVLVYNVGGGPNAAQRARFDRAVRGKPVRVAVLCTSAFTRAIIKAFHLMGFHQMAAFAPDQEEAAFRHLSLKPNEIATLREELAKLRRNTTGQRAAGS
jgi:hypothetical protein